MSFSTDPNEWRDLLDTALEHGSHAWGALKVAGLVPPEAIMDCWPPDVPEGEQMVNVGTPAYHLAALLSYIWQAWNGMCEVYPKPEDDHDG